MELATREKTLLALEPISRIVPITITRMTASITAYSAISWPSSLAQILKNALTLPLVIDVPPREKLDRSRQSNIGGSCASQPRTTRVARLVKRNPANGRKIGNPFGESFMTPRLSSENIVVRYVRDNFENYNTFSFTNHYNS